MCDVPPRHAQATKRLQQLKGARQPPFSGAMSSLTRPVFWMTLLVGVLLAVSASAAYRITQGSAERDRGAVVAGSQGATLTFQSGLVLTLEPGARLRQHKDIDLWLEKEGKSPTEFFTLLDGRVEVERPRRSGQRLVAVLVRTNFKLMGATAEGSMKVIAEPEHGVVASYEGTTVVSTGGKWRRVVAGKAAFVRQHAPDPAFHTLPQVPELAKTKRLWMALHGDVEVGGFSWSPQPSAARYRVVVRDVKQNSTVLDLTRADTQLPENALKLSPGVYELQVQAMDGFRLTSAPSAPLRFTVIGLTESRGARVDDQGVIHLGINQRAQFSHVEGLLMTFGGAKRWVAATNSVPLYRDERTTVHFRFPQDMDIVSVRLEPRGVVADVHVGSKFAKWPGDDVDVVVRLRDESGGNAVAKLEPKIHVLLGLQPIDVTWTRQGDTLRASIPQQSGPGPWIVRVSVIDQYGVELGRDFLEVAQRTTDGNSEGSTRYAERKNRDAETGRVADSR